MLGKDMDLEVALLFRLIRTVGALEFALDATLILGVLVEAATILVAFTATVARVHGGALVLEH